MSMWWIALAVVGALAVLTRPVVGFFNKQAEEAKRHQQLLAVFSAHAEAFMRLSDPVAHADMRSALLWVAERMMTVRLLELLTRADNVAVPRDEALKAEAEFASLSEEARHAFARALGTALTLSALRAPIRSRIRRYYGFLQWTVEAKTRELRDPQQVLFRFRAQQAA